MARYCNSCGGDKESIKSMSNAMATLLIYLIENNLVKVEDLWV